VFFLRLIITAARSLDANFLRSVLAVLGVVLGLMAIISAMSIMEGSRKYILDKVQVLGSNVLYVSPAHIQRTVLMRGTAETLKLQDIPKLKEECDQIHLIAPVVVSTQTLKYFSKSARVTVQGTNTDCAEIHGLKLEGGRFLSREESDSESSTVAVLGHTAAEKLFSGADSVGRPIKIGNKGFRVIGVLTKHGAGGMGSADDTVYIPVRVALKRILRQKQLSRLDIKSLDAEGLSECERQVRGALRRIHKIRPGEKPDFAIRNQQQQLELFKEANLIMSAVFYSIAGISLIVGGIGITNIMLVSVTERTREIGVRIAVGARRGDILFQFMMEALLIGVIGGAGGLLLGVMLANALEAILPGIITVYTPPKVAISAIVVALLVGLASGLYPAYKASQKDPVEALRYE